MSGGGRQGGKCSDPGITSTQHSAVVRASCSRVYVAVHCAGIRAMHTDFALWSGNHNRPLTDAMRGSRPPAPERAASVASSAAGPTEYITYSVERAEVCPRGQVRRCITTLMATVLPRSPQGQTKCVATCRHDKQVKLTCRS